MFPFVPIASWPVTGHHWKQPDSIFFAPSLQPFIYIDEVPLELSLLKTEQSQLFQPSVFRHFSQLPWSVKDYWNGLTMTSPSSLSTHGCIPSEHMDLCKSNLLKYSLTWSSSTKGAPSLLQTFAMVSGAWDSWRSAFATNDKGKAGIQYFSLFHVLHNQVPYLIEQRALVFFLSPVYW